MTIKLLHIIAIFLYLFLPIQFFGQTFQIDSLMAVLQQTDSKVEKSKLYLQLSKKLERGGH